MVIGRLLYHPGFNAKFQRLSLEDQRHALKAEQLFRANPLHPSLRLHPLKGSLSGLWSISVSASIRIIFERMGGGDIVFLSIGRHDIYRSM